MYTVIIVSKYCFVQLSMGKFIYSITNIIISSLWTYGHFNDLSFVLAV